MNEWMNVKTVCKCECKATLSVDRAFIMRIIISRSIAMLHCTLSTKELLDIWSKELLKVQHTTVVSREKLTLGSDGGCCLITTAQDAMKPQWRDESLRGLISALLPLVQAVFHVSLCVLCSLVLSVNERRWIAIAFTTWEHRLLVLSIHICLCENIRHTLVTYCICKLLWVHTSAGSCWWQILFSCSVTAMLQCTVSHVLYVWAVFICSGGGWRLIEAYCMWQHACKCT